MYYTPAQRDLRRRYGLSTGQRPVLPWKNPMVAPSTFFTPHGSIQRTALRGSYRPASAGVPYTFFKQEYSGPPWRQGRSVGYYRPDPRKKAKYRKYSDGVVGWGNPVAVAAEDLTMQAYPPRPGGANFNPASNAYVASAELIPQKGEIGDDGDKLGQPGAKFIRAQDKIGTARGGHIKQYIEQTNNFCLSQPQSYMPPAPARAVPWGVLNSFIALGEEEDERQTDTIWIQWMKLKCAVEFQGEPNSGQMQYCRLLVVWDRWPAQQYGEQWPNLGMILGSDTVSTFPEIGGVWPNIRSEQNPRYANRFDILADKSFILPPNLEEKGMGPMMFEMLVNVPADCKTVYGTDDGDDEWIIEGKCYLYALVANPNPSELDEASPPTLVVSMDLCFLKDYANKVPIAAPRALTI